MNKSTLILFACVFLLFNYDVALGCQCVGNTTAPEALEKAKVVFSGRVMAEEIIRPEKDVYGLPAAEIRLVMTKFKVERWWKGEPGDEILLFTGNLRRADGINIHSTCAYSFKAGESYLIYATEYEGQLVTNHCRGTKALAAAEDDLKELGEGKESGKTEKPNNSFNRSGTGLSVSRKIEGLMH